MIHETLGEDLHLGDFGRGFTSIHETLGEDLQGFARICKTLGEDLHETLERICKDSRDFGRAFKRICETLGEELRDFGKDLQVFMSLSQGFARL